jgi:threonine aldolase
MMKKSVDFRSDTITQPTAEMRDAMAKAIVGDDVYGEDPTITALECRVAAMFHKESALFFPSGTMSNLTATLAWCSERSSEIIVGDKSHMFLFEQAGAAQFGGIASRTVPNLADGTMDLSILSSAIREDDIHEPRTRLICIENTHNACGGKVLPLAFLRDLKAIALERAIPIHMDGARIWNAITAMETTPEKISIYVDSLSVCLSKGLGAPVGSLLVGSTELITKARRIRKALGGGMRQAGVLAAAGLVALDDFESGILQKDHVLAMWLAEALDDIPLFEVYAVETNIIFAHVKTDNKRWASQLRTMGVIVSQWEPFLMRIVVHRDIDDADIVFAIEQFKQLSSELLA